MRGKAFTIVLITACFAASIAHARPVTRTGKAAQHKATHAAGHSAKAPVRQHQTPVRHERGHSNMAASRPEPVSTRGGKRVSPRTRESVSRQSAHLASKRAATAAETAPSKGSLPPVPSEAPAETPIQVHHDRKAHPAPDPPPGPAQNAVNTTADGSTVGEDQPIPDAAPPPAPGINKRHPVKLLVANDEPSVAIHKSKIVVKTPVEELIAAPSLQPVLAYKRGHLIVPPALKGSHEILLHQNEMADREGLDRVQDEDDLERLRDSKLLVAIPYGAGLQVDERLPLNRRYCRPWTAQFLASLGRAHYARFHSTVQVNSAVRTVEFQQRLLLTNGNAAPAEGETASPHLTGQAVDLAKHGLSMTEIAWLRAYLLPLVQQGKVDVEEEFQQSCFHISVYKKYMPQASPKRAIPNRHTSSATSLAAAIR